VHRHITISAWHSSAPAHLSTIRFGRTFIENPQGGKKLHLDSTIAAGATRRVTFDHRKLGGASDEPINLRLDYVYQAPDAGRASDAPEPPLQFWEARLTVADLAACSSTRD
jgi:hypothetical protein